MSGSITQYLEDKIVDHILGTATYTKPSAVYLALYTVAPTKTTSGTEVTGGSYVRKIATFTASSSGLSSNSADISFTSMPTCTVVAVGVFDSLTSGNLLFFSSLDASKSLTNGDTFKIATGDLDISIN